MYCLLAFNSQKWLGCIMVPQHHFFFKLCALNYYNLSNYSSSLPYRKWRNGRVFLLSLPAVCKEELLHHTYTLHILLFFCRVSSLIVWLKDKCTMDFSTQLLFKSSSSFDFTAQMPLYLVRKQCHRYVNIWGRVLHTSICIDAKY